MRKIPRRWGNYLPVGCRVPGTRFLPFKVPLKQELCDSKPESEWFTPSLLVENTPLLKAVIDLTDTDRYYNSEEFTSKGVLYKKINIGGGGRLPSEQKCKQFFDAVDQFSETLGQDSDALIGVHCTHGLNRTGYLICKYMVSRMKIDPQEAISKFQEARGYPMERQNFVNAIMIVKNSKIPAVSTSPEDWRSTPSSTNWRTEPRVDYQPYDHFNRSYRNCGRNDSRNDNYFDRTLRISHQDDMIHGKSRDYHQREPHSGRNIDDYSDRSYRKSRHGDKAYDGSHVYHHRSHRIIIGLIEIATDLLVGLPIIFKINEFVIFKENCEYKLILTYRRLIKFLYEDCCFISSTAWIEGSRIVDTSIRT